MSSLCPSCHAPEGKPHSRDCKAVTATTGIEASNTTRELEASERGVQIRTLGDLETFAIKAAKSVNLNPDQAIVVMQAGMEAGLTPLRALQSLYITQGRVNWYAKAAWGLVLSKDVLQTGPGSDPDSWLELDGKRAEAAALKADEWDRLIGCFQTHRKGWTAPKTTRYGAEQAKVQGLWGKTGSGWAKTPDRMLLAAAKRRHLDDWYDDVLMGITAGESPQDRAEIDVTPLPAQPAPSGPDPLMAQIAGPDPAPAPDSVPDEVPAPRASSLRQAEETGEPSGLQSQEPATTPEEEPATATQLEYSEEQCPGCERVAFLIKKPGHRDDCIFKPVGNRLPTREEVEAASHPF